MPRGEEELERLLVATLGEELLELDARAVHRHRRVGFVDGNAGLAKIIAGARIVGLDVHRLGPYIDGMRRSSRSKPTAPGASRGYARSTGAAKSGPIRLCERTVFDNCSAGVA